MTGKRRKRTTQRNKIRNAKRRFKSLTFTAKQFDEVYSSLLKTRNHLNNMINKCATNAGNNNDKNDSEEDGRPNLCPYKKPKKLRRGPKPYHEDNKEGKCRFQESNSSSEEEAAGVKKTQKVIDEEKKENRKSAQKRDLPENKEDRPAETKPTVEKHAKKVKRNRENDEG